MKQAETEWGIPAAVLREAKRRKAPGFVAHRIFRAKLEPWLKRHPEVAADIEAAARSKESDSEMKRRKLAIAIEHAQLDLDCAKGELVPKLEMQGTLDLAAAIVQEEAKGLMEKDHYRVFIERIRSRLNGVLRFDVELRSFVPGVYSWDGETWTMIEAKTK